jgi:hypothetical protein
MEYFMLDDDKQRSYSFLYNKLANETVTVYGQMDINKIVMANPAYNSFNETFKMQMKYGDFLDEMKDKFKGWNVLTRID